MPAHDPGQRSAISSVAANTKWSQRDPKDPDEAPARARAGLEAKFLRDVDPDGTLPEAERQRRAECARRAYYGRLALASAKARKANRARKAAPPARDAG